ncbi:hypothetical protein J3E69DRAFT_330470 [Trichoderma sp. SZMC 28015]
MSGAEVVGLISAIIAIVDATGKICEAVDSVSGLPRSFRIVAARLPVVLETLDAARINMADENNDSPWTKSHGAIVKVLEGCNDKAVTLEKILQKSMPAAGDSSLRRYIKAIKTMPNAEKVNNLMDGILGDLQILSTMHVVRISSGMQTKRFVPSPQTVEMSRQNSKHRNPAKDLSNFGLGMQYHHHGYGNQNIVSGKGIQINGASTECIYLFSSSKWGESR